jgi:hypothetical protein
MADNSDYLKRLAAFEQAAANLRPITSVLYSYMTGLTAAGFQRSEALVLVQNLQDMILKIALNQGPEIEE